MSKETYRDRVARYFAAHPHQWIDGMTLENIGGRYAWRSRVSDCRTELGMVIENRQRKEWNSLLACFFTKSEYRYVPAVASVPSEAHDLNVGFELKS
jgi:hypothetical protein